MMCYEELLNSYKKYENAYSLYYMGSKTNIEIFIKDIDVFSNYFKSIGLQSGDVFTIYLPNTIQSFAVFYALNKIGAVANIVHPLTSISKLKKLIEETNSKGLIVLDILVNECINELKAFNTNIIVARNSDYVHGIKKPFFKLYEMFKASNIKKLENFTLYSKIQKSKYEPSQNIFVFNDVAALVHSGGTSGESKTISLSNDSICSLSNELMQIYERVENQFTPVVLPIFHAYGLAAGMHCALIAGSNLIVFPKFNAKKINKSIIKYNVSTIMSVPLMIAKMMAEKNFAGKHLRKLKNVYCGGDTVPTSLVNKFDETVKKFNGSAKLLAGYGLTEVCSVVSVNTNQNNRLGSVGKPLKCVTIEIWNDKNETLLPHEIGEIVVGGETLMNGYFHSEDSGITKRSGTNFIKTGDLGYFDDEGFLFICGRIKRLIKIAAYNIFPTEIEDTVLQLTFVKEACVFECAKNEKKVIKLVVSLNEVKLTESEIKLAIIVHCEKNLIKYSLPSEIEILDELPHTPIGKVDYVKLSCTHCK